MSNEIKLEFYNAVQDGHTTLANMLYNTVLEHFDEQYRIYGGTLNSVQHFLDRDAFSQMVRKSIFEELDNQDGETLKSIGGTYEMYIPSLDITIGAYGESRDFKTKQEADMWQYMEANYN